MKFTVTLQISHDKKSVWFYIPITYEDQIKKLKNKDSVISCLDWEPPIKFVAKLYVHSDGKYVKYLYHIPKKYISIITKEPLSKVYQLDIKKL